MPASDRNHDDLCKLVGMELQQARLERFDALDDAS